MVSSDPVVDPSVSVAVMAHRKRRRLVPVLLSRLDREAQVVWDRYNDRWDTGRRALLAHDSDATHHLVIQDDALPCRQLVAGCEKMLRVVPHDTPVALYMGTARTKPRFDLRPYVARATARGIEFLAFEGPWWGLAVVVPTVHIADIVAYGDSQSHIENYDHKIANWYVQQSVACWYTVPSLVEHHTHGPSLVAGRRNTRGRTAAEFVGLNVSAAERTWTGRTLDAVAVARGRFPATPYSRPRWEHLV